MNAKNRTTGKSSAKKKSRKRARSVIEHPTKTFPPKLQALVDDLIGARSALKFLCCGAWPRFPDDGTIGEQMGNYWSSRLAGNQVTRAEVNGIRAMPSRDLIALKHVMVPILGEAMDRFYGALLSGSRLAAPKRSSVTPHFSGKRDPDRSGVDFRWSADGKHVYITFRMP